MKGSIRPRGCGWGKTQLCVELREHYGYAIPISFGAFYRELIPRAYYHYASIRSGSWILPDDIGLQPRIGNPGELGTREWCRSVWLVEGYRLIPFRIIIASYPNLDLDEGYIP